MTRRHTAGHGSGILADAAQLAGSSGQPGRLSGTHLLPLLLKSLGMHVANIMDCWACCMAQYDHGSSEGVNEHEHVLVRPTQCSCSNCYRRRVYSARALTLTCVECAAGVSRLRGCASRRPRDQRRGGRDHRWQQRRARATGIQLHVEATPIDRSGAKLCSVVSAGRSNALVQ